MRAGTRILPVLGISYKKSSILTSDGFMVAPYNNLDIKNCLCPPPVVVMPDIHLVVGHRLDLELDPMFDRIDTITVHHGLQGIIFYFYGIDGRQQKLLGLEKNVEMSQPGNP